MPGQMTGSVLGHVTASPSSLATGGAKALLYRQAMETLLAFETAMRAAGYNWFDNVPESQRFVRTVIWYDALGNIVPPPTEALRTLAGIHNAAVDAYLAAPTDREQAPGNEADEQFVPPAFGQPQRTHRGQPPGVVDELQNQMEGLTAGVYGVTLADQLSSLDRPWPGRPGEGVPQPLAEQGGPGSPDPENEEI